MERVRAALGSEAIILKNRSVPGGIEILATIDDPDHGRQAGSGRAHRQREWSNAQAAGQGLRPKQKCGDQPIRAKLEPMP